MNRDPITDRELHKLFRNIQLNRVTLTLENDRDATIRVYHTKDGWKIAIFNDCDAWDYIEWIESPDKRVRYYSDLKDDFVRRFIDSQRQKPADCWNW